MATNTLIALGGNLGDVAGCFLRAIERLNSVGHSQVQQVSHTYRTVAVGDVADVSYLNAILTLETKLPPLRLLTWMHEIEHELGRERSLHWGPRTIDLDLILYDAEVISSDTLTVPHPACFYRRFVLDPAVEIAADWRHPVFNLTLQALRDRLLQRPLPISILGSESLFAQLARETAIAAELKSVAPDGAAVIFDLIGHCSEPHSLDLSQMQNPDTVARQILLAMTDEPHPVLKNGDS